MRSTPGNSNSKTDRERRLRFVRPCPRTDFKKAPVSEFDSSNGIPDASLANSVLAVALTKSAAGTEGFPRLESAKDMH